MAVNSIFHTSNVAALATEQNLYRDLVIESIQIYGHDVHYLDRTLVNEDTIMGTVLRSLPHKRRLKCTWKIVKVGLLVRRN